jgi:hypothetical protein
MNDVFLDWERDHSRVLYAYQDAAGTRLRPGLCPDNASRYIEEDHYGAMVYSTGVKYDDPRRRELGLRMLMSGLDRQQADGSFSCEDAHHSAAFFLEALARYLIVAGHRDEPAPALCNSGLRVGLEWFHRRSSWNDDWWRDSFHHRFFLNGAALFLGCHVIADPSPSALEQAYAWMAEGVRRQEDDGAITEHGGTDTGYQSLSITFIAGVLMVCNLHDTFRQQLTSCLDRATDWLLSRVDGNGEIDGSANTRMTHASGERDRISGKPKGLKPYETAFALRGAGLLRGNSTALDKADRIMANAGEDAA